MNEKLYISPNSAVPKKIPNVYNGISNYNLLGEEKWLQDGWKIYIDSPPEYNPKTQQLIKLNISQDAERQYQVIDYSFQEIKNRIIKLLAQKRYEREVGGIVFHGIPVKTDRESTALINGAFSYVATQDENVTISFKSEAGFLTLTKEQVIGISIAVAQHIQAQFDWEKDVMNDINEAETIEELILIEEELED
jgi:hypothetical protein